MKNVIFNFFEKLDCSSDPRSPFAKAVSFSPTTLNIKQPNEINRL